jgi:PIN domain nuclease of toxin-antitoxin system
LRLLLDTHIWLWSLREPERLGKAIRGMLAGRSEELWLSPISIWEALILIRKGRIAVAGDVGDWVAAATAQFREAPLTWEIAKTSEQIGLFHADPADRFLAATAKVLGLTLVTADKNLLGLADIATLANR